MLKKELTEVLKQLILFTLVILLLPAVLLITTIVSNQSYFSVLFPIFQFGLLFLALFMGASLFSNDRRQRGMEYLLSLPYSRFQLVGLKILPRLTSVVIFYLLYLVLYQAGGENFMIMLFIPFTIIYFVLFFVALSLSAISDNFVVLSVVSIFSLFVYLVLLYLAYYVALLLRGIPPSEFGFRFNDILMVNQDWLPGFIAVVAVALLLPFLISSILSFRKFDVRPAKVYNKRYIKYFTPVFFLGLIISVSFAFLGTSLEEYNFYYLTQDHKLIESSFHPKIKIYERDKVYKVKSALEFFWPQLEENEYVYDMFGDEVARLNTSLHTCEILYEAPRRMRVGWIKWKYGHTIVFLEKVKDSSDIQLVLLDDSSKKITRIPIDYKQLIDYYSPIIFGTNIIDGKRFWLICSAWAWKQPILRVWENGKTEEIGNSQKRPLYVNQMLITYTDQAIIISREREGRFETIKEIPEGKDLRLLIGFHIPINLNNPQFREIYAVKEIQGRQERKFFRLDLETIEIEEIGEFKGGLRHFFPDEFYFVETDRPAGLRKIYLLKEGKLKLIKSFSNIDTSKEGNFFNIFKGGVVLKKDKEIKAYAFPDLKEIEFKNL